MKEWVLIIVLNSVICASDVENPPCEKLTEVRVVRDLNYFTCKYEKSNYPVTDDVILLKCQELGEMADVRAEHLIARQKQAKMLKKEN